MNRALNIVLLIAIAAGFSLSGCNDGDALPEIKKAEPSLTLSFHLAHNNDALDLNEAFIDEQGNNVKIVAFKFYMANITLKSNSSEVLLSDMELFDQRPFDASISTPQWRAEYSYDVEEAVYDSLVFGVGVTPALNQIDPTVYSNNDPLSTYSNMYWSWASMYRFIILEAKVDTNGGDNFDHDVIFHTGLDDLYRSNIARLYTVEFTVGENKKLDMIVNWNDLFYRYDYINIKQESVTHGTDNQTEFDLAERFTDNFVKSITIKE